MLIFQYLNMFNKTILENYLPIKLMFSGTISLYMEKLKLELHCNKIAIIIFKTLETNDFYAI